MKECIYVVEDDENIREIIDLALTSAGYNVKQFSNALDALKSMENDQVDLAVFDLMLPGISGIDAIKKIRETDQELPILILSAKDREIDKVNGLDSGSDDYMTKPFGVLELQARVRSLLRRHAPKAAPIIESQTLKIDKQTRTVMHNGQVMELTNKEYQLLLYLVENHTRVVERDEILNHIWGYDFIGESRVLDVHIRALRAKLDVNQDLVYTDLSNKAMVEKAVEELKKSGVECILCQDDYICDEVVRKLARMGVRIPDQMKVASCHYSRILENYPVTITSLKFNITELGRRSCQVLLDMIHGKTVPDKTLLDYEIILKESTKG